MTLATMREFDSKERSFCLDIIKFENTNAQHQLAPTGRKDKHELLLPQVRKS